MRGVRASTYAIVLAGALAAIAGRAQTEPAGPRITVAWRAPEGCPDQASVEAAIARMLAGSPESVDAHADVGRLGERYRVKVVTRGGERTLDADTCRELADATALILAMAADPARVVANRVESADAGSDGAASDAAATDAMAAADAAPTSTPTSTPTPTPTSTPAPTPTDFSISASALLDLGTLPNPSLTPSLAFAWTPSPLRFELSGFYLFPNSSSPNAHLAAGRFSLLAGDLRGCYVAQLASFQLGPCVGLELGSFHGSAVGVTQGFNASTTWVGFEGGAYGAWSFAEAWALFARAAVLAPTQRPDFEVDGLSVHKPGAIGGRGGVGGRATLLITDHPMSGHSSDVPQASAALPAHASRADGAPPQAAVAAAQGVAPHVVERFETVYAENFAFAWRSVRRLGVDASAVDDVVQEVFLVVHRRLAEFEARAAMKTWLFAIVLRVVRAHRRTLRRKPAQLGGKASMDADVDAVRDSSRHGPHESAAQSEAVRALHAILDELADEKREVFVLAELEQMTVPEIAEAVDANVNTVYSRLRSARRDFDEAVARHRAKDEWRTR